MIKSIFLIFIRMVLQFIYIFIKLFPQKNKVVFISRQNNYPSLDFFELKRELNDTYPELATLFLCRTLGKTFGSAVSYSFHMLKQMYHISTSKVVVLDSYCIVVSLLNHKKNTKVIQIWHALGILKKFGFSSIGKYEGAEEKVARLMRMHKNYDYIICSSPYIKSEIAESYGVSEDKIISLGLPRIDYLSDESKLDLIKNEILNRYEILRNDKKTILYVPTFRKDIQVNYKKLVKRINLDKYNFIIKFHGKYEKIYVGNTVVSQGSDLTGMHFLAASDYVISDYSAIIFEAAVAHKPLFLYCYDFDTYMQSRGLFIDYYSIPATISESENEIVQAIESDIKLTKQQELFTQRYVSNTDVSLTKSLASLIYKCSKGEEINEYQLLGENKKERLQTINI